LRKLILAIFHFSAEYIQQLVLSGFSRRISRNVSLD
jgi:hypothetical protein